MSIITLPKNGDSRWSCECGQRFVENETAFKHALNRHECIFEVFAFGRWCNDGTTAIDMILLGKHLKGESRAAFIERVKVAAEREGVAHHAD